MRSTDDRRDEQESFGGARKLIRPLLSAVARRRSPVATADPLTRALTADASASPAASSHAEAFYFQKQIQQGTEMTIVLDDGEEIHGTLEWYDRSAVKVRAGRHRTLVYKSAIKYLYKTSDAHPAGTVMQ